MRLGAKIFYCIYNNNYKKKKHLKISTIAASHQTSNKIISGACILYLFTLKSLFSVHLFNKYFLICTWVFLCLTTIKEL